MPRECAFCPNTAKLTGEHIWSDWINPLLPGRKRFNIRNDKRQVIKTWTSPQFNWKAKVVCGTCNSGWMSNLENQHAKPSLSALILGKPGVLINQSRAKSIALFAFKNAVVFDHLATSREPFFERSVRHEFRTSFAMPPNVTVFLAKFAPGGFGEANTLYFEGQLPAPNFLHTYVLTYSIEHVVIQIAAYKKSHGVMRASVKNKFGVPVWPRVPDGFVWPPARAISSVQEFDEFSDRWYRIMATF